MKLNVIQYFKAFNPTDKKAHLKNEKNEDIVLKEILVSAVLGGSAEKLSGDEKLKRYRLANRIFDSDNSVEMSAEELALTKAALSESNLPVVVLGQALEMIENLGKN